MEKLRTSLTGQAFIFAATFTLAAITLLMILAPNRSTSESFLRVAVPNGWRMADQESNPVLRSYLRLNNWDSLHFFDIARNEYHLPSGTIEVSDIHEYRANAVYFPGYPLLVRGFAQLTTLPLDYALLIVAQILAFVFWIYFFTLGLASGLKREMIWVLGAFIFIQPGAFYLVTGFSESLFLAGLLGYIYWSVRAIEKQDMASLGLAMLHGFAMASSRIVGIPLALFPLLYLGARDLYRGSFLIADYLNWKLFLLIGVAAFGGLSFFVFCQQEFGNAKIYFDLQGIGWGTSANYLTLLDPRLWFPRFFFEPTPQSIDRTSVVYLLGVFGLLLYQFKAFWSEKKDPMLLASSFLAFGLFFVSASGKGNTQMAGMMRYAFPIVALCALPLGVLGNAGKRRFHLGIFILGTVLFATELWSAFRFLRGRWVS